MSSVEKCVGTSLEAPAWATVIRGRRRLRVLLVSFFSQRYPSLGESHGLSVVAGALQRERAISIDLHLIDLVGTGTEDCTGVRRKIESWKPDILGIGLQYGTFTIAKREYPSIRKALPTDSLVIFGGPLATYLYDRVITEVEPQSFVVVGEGEVALSRLLLRLVDGDRLDDVPNIAYTRPGGRVPTLNFRALVRAEDVPQPYRGHVAALAANGAQIFAESSRACSWAACSFCLRGLTDVEGQSKEFRRLPLDRLKKDLHALCDRDIRNFTFADEDFLGGNIQDTEAFVADLCSVAESLPPLSFDLSATVHSLASEKDSPEITRRKSALLRKLRRIGLRKVFLGIESGVRSQLRRYAKGHSPAEAALAAKRVLGSGAALELGWIMFDPLCTLHEVSENLAFLRRHGLTPYVSSLSSELRVQTKSRYLTLLDVYKKRTGEQLCEGSVDPDTLQHTVHYTSPAVAALVAEVRAAERRSRPLAYPVKSLSRFGRSGALGAAAESTREALSRFREQLCTALLASVLADTPEPFRQGADDALHRLATDFTKAIKDSDAVLEVPIVVEALREAHRIAGAKSRRRANGRSAHGT